MPDFFAPRGKRFDLVNDIPDLGGQVYIVTGASSGLGFAIVAHLLAHNAAKIITLSSRRQEAVESIERLRAWGDVSKIVWKHCDLSSLRQVDQVAQSLLQEEPRVDAIVLNAAIGITPSRLSKDGIDAHFQINMLAQLHLGLTLLPTLNKTALANGTPARLVFMSSATEKYCPKATRFASLEELNQDLGTEAHYYRSKLAQILIVRELARRLESNDLINAAEIPQSYVDVSEIKGSIAKETPSYSNVLVNATHPGDYNRTSLTEHLKKTFGIFGWILLFFIGPFMSDPMTEGCTSALFACTTNWRLLQERPSGQYIVPSQRIVQPSQRAKDAHGLGVNVWNLSMRLLADKLLSSLS